MASQEARHPFYRPLWVRVAITAVVIGWSILEWVNDQPIWGTLTAAIAAWAIWIFFITYDPDAPRAETSEPPDHSDNDRETRNRD